MKFVRTKNVAHLKEQKSNNDLAMQLNIDEHSLPIQFLAAYQVHLLY